MDTDTDVVETVVEAVVEVVAPAVTTTVAPVVPPVVEQLTPVQSHDSALTPDAFDAISVAACMVIAEATKIIVERTASVETADKVKSAMPVLVIFLGALIRTSLELGFTSGDLKTALVRGAVAGITAVYGHAVGKGFTGKSQFLSVLVEPVIGLLVKPKPVESKKDAGVQPPTDAA